MIYGARLFLKRISEASSPFEAASMSRELQMLFAAPPGMQTGDKYYGSSNRRPPRVRASPSPLNFEEHDSFAMAYDSGQSSAAEDDDDQEGHEASEQQHAHKSLAEQTKAINQGQEKAQAQVLL